MDYCLAGRFFTLIPLIMSITDGDNSELLRFHTSACAAGDGGNPLPQLHPNLIWTESLHNYACNYLNPVISNLDFNYWLDNWVFISLTLFLLHIYTPNKIHSCILNCYTWKIFSKNSSRADWGIFINRYFWSGFPGIASVLSCCHNRAEISSNKEQIPQIGSNQC